MAQSAVVAKQTCVRGVRGNAECCDDLLAAGQPPSAAAQQTSSSDAAANPAEDAWSRRHMPLLVPRHLLGELGLQLHVQRDDLQANARQIGQ